MPTAKTNKSEPKSAEKSANKKTGSSQKRELIEPNNDKRFVKRDAQGKFSESDDVGKSLSADVKEKAKTKVKSGYGDQGDQVKKKN